MAKNSIDAYGASGKTNVLMFEPEKLHLVTDKDHPLYDERIHLPISEAMVLNIMDQGVLEPIIVWKDPESGLACVVDGRQRVRHTLEANKRLVKQGESPLLVPAVTKRGSAVRMAQAMVSANEIRQADTPLGRAKKMADALERGHDEDDLALMFGVSVQTVRATLSLLDATRLFAMQWSPERSPLPRRVSWHRLTLKSSGRRSLKSKRQLLAQPAMKKPGVSELCLAKLSHV